MEFRDRQFDLVTMIGVMSIFDDFKPSLGECIRVAKKGAYVFVVGVFNEFPVDALIRWRYSGEAGVWNPGHNLFSKKSVSGFLEQQAKVGGWHFEKFTLPFDLAAQAAPIRSWTEFDKDGNRVFKNGLQMELNFQILTIAPGKIGPL